MNRRQVLPLILVGLAAELPPRTARADDYPTRTVTFVIPFSPGGNFDIVMRAVGQRLGDRLGKPFIIENRPGAGTVLAAAAVARAAADGHTLLVAASGTLTINPSLYKKLSYDPLRDFVPIALVTRVPLLLVVRPSLPVRTVSDLIALAKGAPGQLSYASNGPGTSFHLSAELLKSMAGIDMMHVTYKGAIPALTDVVAGHVDLMFADAGSSLPHVRAGKLRALGVSSLTRMPQATDIPTVSESGLPGFEAVSWSMVLAPAHTPDETVGKLYAEFANILALPDVQQQIMDLGLVPVVSPPPKELHRFIESETAQWAALLRRIGLAASE